MSDNNKKNPAVFEKKQTDWFSKTGSDRTTDKSGAKKEKTPKEYVHEAFRRGNGKEITRYLLRYFELQKEQKAKVEPDIIAVAQQIFNS